MARDLTALQYHRLEEATQTLWLTVVLTPWEVRELSHAVRLRPTRRHNMDEHSPISPPKHVQPKCKATKYPPQWYCARHSREIVPYIAAFQLHGQGSVTCKDSAHSLALEILYLFQIRRVKRSKIRPTAEEEGRTGREKARAMR